MTASTGVGPELARRVRNMVREYVYRKAEARTGEKRDQFPHVKDERGRERIQESERYREACQRACEEAFLAMRSRKTRDEFATYFVGTVCAVPQLLPEADYIRLSQDLFADDDRWQQIKSLAMLTASALAYRDTRDAPARQTQEGE